MKPWKEYFPSIISTLSDGQLHVATMLLIISNIYELKSKPKEVEIILLEVIVVLFVSLVFGMTSFQHESNGKTKGHDDPTKPRRAWMSILLAIMAVSLVNYGHYQIVNEENNSCEKG